MRPFPSLARPFALLAATGLLLGLAACEADDDGPIGPIGGDDASAPRNVTVESDWVFYGWLGTEPSGQPAVQVTWDLPTEWDGEPFRVYAKRASVADYTLIATVTSCAEGVCRYTDLNVAPGQEYDYFVATEQRSGGEEPSTAVSVDVPASSNPQPPAAPLVRALDNALYLQWEATGGQYYQVLLEEADGLVLVGETDGLAFLDTRALNGTEYSYRIVSIGEDGQYSRQSAAARGTPRPDYHAELIYAQSDNDAASGFRFPAEEGANPIVAGSSTSAQWRIESSGGSLVIRPLNGTAVTAGVFTTELACGPGSDPDCESVDQAPAAAAFLTTPVAVGAGNTYVFRVQGADGRTRYGKARVQGVATDAAGDPVVVFDWAYQTRPDTPSLSVGVVR